MATSRRSSVAGADGLNVAKEDNIKVKGGLGVILVIAEGNTCNDKNKDWKGVVVDDLNVKADVRYKLEDGELVEVIG